MQSVPVAATATSFEVGQRLERLAPQRHLVVDDDRRAAEPLRQVGDLRAVVLGPLVLEPGPSHAYPRGQGGAIEEDDVVHARRRIPSDRGSRRIGGALSHAITYTLWNLDARQPGARRRDAAHRPRSSSPRVAAFRPVAPEALSGTGPGTLSASPRRERERHRMHGPVAARRYAGQARELGRHRAEARARPNRWTASVRSHARPDRDFAGSRVARLRAMGEALALEDAVQRERLEVGEDLERVARRGSRRSCRARAPAVRAAPCRGCRA